MSIEELNGWKAREYDALKASVAELESVRDNLSRAYAVQGLALEEERTRVAELEAAIHSHKDHYIFTTPDFEDLELWKLVEPKP